MRHLLVICTVTSYRRGRGIRHIEIGPDSQVQSDWELEMDIDMVQIIREDRILSWSIGNGGEQCSFQGHKGALRKQV